MKYIVTQKRCKVLKCYDSNLNKKYANNSETSTLAYPNRGVLTRGAIVMILEALILVDSTTAFIILDSMLFNCII